MYPPKLTGMSNPMNTGWTLMMAAFLMIGKEKTDKGYSNILMEVK